MKLSQAFMAYKELFQTGGIQCTAESENILLDLRGNLAGDILVFIGPKNNTLSARSDIYELIRSDSSLEQQREIVFKSLRQKFKGLCLLPESIVWLINIGISTFYIFLKSNRIFELCSGEIDLAGILTLLPIAVILAITPFLGKAIGLKILKPFLSFTLWIVKLSRKIRNPKIEP
jgi:hypothetical protein